MMKNVAGKMMSNLEDRGAQFKFMWANVALEKEFRSVAGVKSTPSFVILRPNTNKLMNHEETSITEDALKRLLDKIAGGDA